MSILATGNAIEAVMDAVRDRLRGDVALRASVTGIYEQLPAAARVTLPYVQLSAPLLQPQLFGAMGTSGGRIQFAVDVWSDAKGPHELRAILAQIRVLLMRVDLIIANHRWAGGSLTTVEERDFDEPDADMPERRLWHGHQTWEGLLEES